MAYGLGEKIENKLSPILAGKKRAARMSHKYEKKSKHRAERRRANKDFDCVPAYNRHHGWEW
ncbi:MAG TPA: hypothetical protein DCZ95_04740 [Verrucomicrobia bacterium]|nr:hypothetical protein [Verrucomicrobiota bacterium]